MSQPSALGLYRVPSPLPLSGMAIRTPLGGPFVRQSAASSANTTPVGMQFTSEPLPGSLLVACVCANNSGASVGSGHGGGVDEWHAIAGTAASGTGNTSLASYWGIVGEIPSKTVGVEPTSGASGAGAIVVEFVIPGLVGVADSVKSTSGNGTTQTTTGNFAGLGGWLFGIASSLNGNTGATAPFALARQFTPTRDVAIWYMPERYTAQATLSLSATFTSGTNVRANWHTVIIR